VSTEPRHVLLALGIGYALGAATVVSFWRPPPPPSYPTSAVPPPPSAATRSSLPDDAPPPVGVFRAEKPSASPFVLVALTPDGHFLRAKSCGGPVDHGTYHLRRLRDATVMGMSRVLQFEDDRLHEPIDLFVYELEGSTLRAERMPTLEGVRMSRSPSARLRFSGEPCDVADCEYCNPPLGCNAGTHRCQ
jgi:hypothetical protein